MLDPASEPAKRRADYGRSTWGLAIVVAALLLRILYVAMAHIEYPIRGDVNQYVLCAWNLEHRFVFSSALPDEPAQPESYRAPGYPALLASAMLLAGHSELPLRDGPNGLKTLGYDTDTWMTLVIAAQVLLGTATVWLTMLLGRTWLSERWALAAGVLAAIWPHLISFTGVMLSETLFSFLILLSLWLLVRAERSDRRDAPWLAGLAFGATALVNPLVLVFPAVAAGILVVRRGCAPALAFALAFVVGPALWMARDSYVPGGSGSLVRAEENLVQGSWPQLYDAYNSRFHNEISRRIMAAIDNEVELMKRSPRAGFGAIAQRMSLDPGWYLRWYLLEKPFLLWDWSIRIGTGDIYFLPVQHSAFEKIPLLHATKDGLRWLNPLLFALAAASAVYLGMRALLRPRADRFGGMLAAVFVLYVTAVHVALQAEPRYAIPYRPLEFLLAMTTLAGAASWLSKKRASAAPIAASPDPAIRHEAAEVRA